MQRTKARASASQVWSCRSVRSVAVEWHSGSCAGYYKPTPSPTADPMRPPTPSPTVDSTPSEGDHDAGHKVQADSKLVGCASIATQTRSLFRAFIRGIVRARLVLPLRVSLRYIAAGLFGVPARWIL